MNVLNVTSENYESEVLKSEKTVLIDFYADWCGPCKMLGPVLEKTESDLKVIKVDTDEFEDLAREYGVMSIPTLVLIERGKEIKRNIGFLDKNGLEKWLR